MNTGGRLDFLWDGRGNATCRTSQFRCCWVVCQAKKEKVLSWWVGKVAWGRHQGSQLEALGDAVWEHIINRWKDFCCAEVECTSQMRAAWNKISSCLVSSNPKGRIRGELEGKQGFRDRGQCDYWGTWKEIWSFVGGLLVELHWIYLWLLLQGKKVEGKNHW